MFRIVSSHLVILTILYFRTQVPVESIQYNPSSSLSFVTFPHHHGKNLQNSDQKEVISNFKKMNTDYESHDKMNMFMWNHNFSKRRCQIMLKAGFFDNLWNGNLFDNKNNGDYNVDDTPSNKREESENNNDETSWNEEDFRKELLKRKDEVDDSAEPSFRIKELTGMSSTVTPEMKSTSDESLINIQNENNDDKQDNDKQEETEFDGYALRDAIYKKWGKCYDIDFQPVQTFGFRELYLNVLPFALGGRRFRHETELDYLCHLQAIVEILEKYDQLDYVLAQLEETNKKPRAGTSPLVAVPFRLDLTEDELNSILS